MADVARNVDVGQEVHLDLDQAVALARLAAPALDVEREAPRPVAALARLLDLREELADRREQARCRSPGFERGVRPIGLWSTLITLSKCSSPSISS